jgi:hypothetical protein
VTRSTTSSPLRAAEVEGVSAMPVPTKHPAQRWVGKFAHGSEVFHKNIPNICGRNYAEKGSDHFWYYVLSFFLYFYKRLF